MSPTPTVMMKDGSYKNCKIKLVHQWVRKNTNGTEDDMGIIVIQPKDPVDSHPFTNTVKLSEIDFISFR